MEKYRNIVVQIATPYATGTGFYLSKYGLIVTNEHTVRDNKQVALKGKYFNKQMGRVVFVDELSDLAFLRAESNRDIAPIEITTSTLGIGDRVVALGHPFGHEFSAMGGEVSSTDHQIADVGYILHDAALNPGNSGGPLSKDGNLVGMNTFMLKKGVSVGYALPMEIILERLEAFTESGYSAATQCSACQTMIEDDGSGAEYCTHCGSSIHHVSGYAAYEPRGVGKTLEDLLGEMGFDVALSRTGLNNWSMYRGSALINISYHEKTGLITGDAHLCKLPEDNILELYQYLLRENYRLEGLTFSVKDRDIIISLLIFDQYLNASTGKELFENLFELADHYDDVLVDRYKATWD